MKEHRKTFTGFMAMRLPLVATAIIILIIAAIIANFAIVGVPYLSWEFLTEPPRNMNTEGGIFPAIFGTMLLVIIMTLAAVPVGTITAIYLTEYARQRSPLARTIRFAVNTLAGVPSIVFGLFGVGFFIQTIGASVDRVNWNAQVAEFRTAMQEPRAPLLNGAGASVLTVQEWMRRDDPGYWQVAINHLNNYPNGPATVAGVEEVASFLDTRTDLYWGKPNILWAALTLALLTMPVVIVSVEEALRAVPRDVRDASIALGATKWETIRKIVLPNAVGGILTGSILAVGRGTGEVAPILFTGVIYSQQNLPTALTDPFMHLGYHLFILATQSPDVEATRPLQYATTIVLLALTLALNFTAVTLRSRIRRRRVAT